MFHSFPSPTSHRQIQFTLSEIRNLKSGDARQANALTSQHLVELSHLIKKENCLRSHRDLAIYYLMFECALKRSELKILSLDDVVQQENGWLINIDKTPYQLSIAATEALSRWLSHLNANHGFLFRRIDKHNNIGNHQLDDSSIYRILRRASDRLGLDKNHRFTGQSARVGATQELDKQGYNVRDIQDFGRWLSPAMPAQYLQMQQVSEAEKTRFKTIKPWT
jgi:integrase